jgi:hypothetical protein
LGTSRENEGQRRHAAEVSSFRMLIELNTVHRLLLVLRPMQPARSTQQKLNMTPIPIPGTRPPKQAINGEFHVPRFFLPGVPRLAWHQMVNCRGGSRECFPACVSGGSGSLSFAPPSPALKSPSLQLMHLVPGDAHGYSIALNTTFPACPSHRSPSQITTHVIHCFVSGTIHTSNLSQMLALMSPPTPT